MPRKPSTERVCARCQRTLPLSSFSRKFKADGRPDGWKVRCDSCLAAYWDEMKSRSNEPPNPSGLCMCGCGKITNISPDTDRTAHRLKGQHVRYIRGHDPHPSPRYIVDPETGCWRWQRSTNRSGYGMVNISDSSERMAHRYFYERKYGPIPEGMELDHVRERGCRYRDCVNPDHLEPVIKLVNVQRGMNAKLTPADVREIRNLAGESTSDELATRFGVRRETINTVIRRDSWPNIT